MLRRLLRRLFGPSPIKPPPGISLEEPDAWEIAATRDVERFLRALTLLASPGAMMYFEATGERHVAEYLQRVAVPPPVQVAAGTIWPRPDVYHVPLSPDTTEALAAFLETRPAGFFCAHCHVYAGNAILLQWHDAFGDDPMTISRRIGTDRVAAFAAAIGSSYTRTSTG